MARCRGKQIIAAHNVGDRLQSVIDDHGQVVGRNTIVAAEHNVIDWSR
jgi:hypothetical protein